MNLFQKMVELRKSVTGLNKDTRGYGYDYVSGDQVLSKVRGKMDELNLLLIPQVTVGEHSEWEYTNSNGDKKKEVIVAGDMSYCWINADNPEEKLVIPWAYFGQMDDASKAFGASLTYSERYFLLKFLALPTDSDDPDAKGVSQPKAPAKQAPKQQPQQNQQEKSQQQKDAEDVFDIDKDQKQKQQKQSSTKKITDGQIKRLYAMAGVKQDKDKAYEIVYELLAEHGYKEPEDIPMGNQYDLICEEAKKRAFELAS